MFHQLRLQFLTRRGHMQHASSFPARLKHRPPVSSHLNEKKTLFLHGWTSQTPNVRPSCKNTCADSVQVDASNHVGLNVRRRPPEPYEVSACTPLFRKYSRNVHQLGKKLEWGPLCACWTVPCPKGQGIVLPQIAGRETDIDGRDKTVPCCFLLPLSQMNKQLRGILSKCFFLAWRLLALLYCQIAPQEHAGFEPSPVYMCERKHCPPYSPSEASTTAIVLPLDDRNRPQLEALL